MSLIFLPRALFVARLTVSPLIFTKKVSNFTQLITDLDGGGGGQGANEKEDDEWQNQKTPQGIIQYIHV
jgi:hypothetical protein